jgi:replicative DNA helicase
MKTEKKPELMPFSDIRQQALIGHMFKDSHVFTLVREHLVPGNFTTPRAQGAYEVLLDWWERHKSYPTVKDVLAQTERLSVLFSDPPVRNGVIAYITAAPAEAAQLNREAILRDLDEWVKVVLYHEGSNESTRLYNDQKFKEAYVVMKKAIDNVLATDLVDEGSIYWTEFAQVVDDRQHLHDDLLTFGLNDMDRCLLEPTETRLKQVGNVTNDFRHLVMKQLKRAFVDKNYAEVEKLQGMMRGTFYGSLRKGDTTILLAPTNVGKTTALITVSAINALLGHNVLFLSHEGVKEDIQMKMIRCVLGVTENEVLSTFLKKDPERMKTYDYAMYALDRHLVYQSVQVANNTVENVISKIITLNDRRKAVDGHGFDLLTDDYPANLTTEEAKMGKLSRRERDDKVYGSFVDLAGQLSLHALLAIQTNREGSRKNKDADTDASAILEVEDVSESFGTMMRATNVISINRPPAGEKNNWLLYNVAKTRSAEKGWKVTCTSDFAHGRAHWWDLPSTYGNGNNVNVANIEHALKTSPGQRYDYKAYTLPK